MSKEKLKELWYKRNPCHDLNASSEEDMFWGTVLMVIEDYNREIRTDQTKEVKTSHKIKERIKSLMTEKEELLKEYLNTPADLQDVLSERNMRINIELKFLNELSGSLRN